VDSFNAGLRDELLDGEIFYTLKEAKIVIESWRCHYNAVRPHASLGYRPPAPEVLIPALAAWPSARPQTAPTATLPLAPRPPLNYIPAGPLDGGRSLLQYDLARSHLLQERHRCNFGGEI
jgi:hypothetical protein